jgi:hypothetical protein
MDEFLIGFDLGEWQKYGCRVELMSKEEFRLAIDCCRKARRPNKDHMQKRSYLFIISMALLSTATMRLRDVYARSVKMADVKTVAAKGRLVGSDYENDYFRLTVHIPQPNTWEKINTIIADDRAQLLQAINTKGPREQRHNFVIIVHSTDIPRLRSITQYVRSVRHMYEREGLKTVTSEVSVKYAGHQFIQSILKSDDPEQKLFKGISCTMLNDYIFGFWVEGANEAEVRKLLNLDARLKFW